MRLSSQLPVNPLSNHIGMKNFGLANHDFALFQCHPSASDIYRAAGRFKSETMHMARCRRLWLEVSSFGRSLVEFASVSDYLAVQLALPAMWKLSIPPFLSFISTESQTDMMANSTRLLPKKETSIQPQAPAPCHGLQQETTSRTMKVR